MLVVAGEGWHRGVIGIVASKLVDAFYRPAIVLSIDGDMAHGSCRSIPGFDMLAALESCAPMMKRFGGHKAAAGLQIETGTHQGVPARPSTRTPRAISARTTCARRSGSTARSSFDDITDRVMSEFAALAPFGPAIRGRSSHTGPVAIVDGPRVLKERHLKMTVKQNGRVLRAHPVERRRARTGRCCRRKTASRSPIRSKRTSSTATKYVELRLEDFR